MNVGRRFPIKSTDYEYCVSAISPSSLCYNETINTLLYAQRAKNIVNKPVINEDPVIRLVSELRAEISRLQSLLHSQVRTCAVSSN